MARVKPKRHGIHMDMTAMSDMAWLLLTFFILTTQFKPKEVVTIDPPTSVSKEKIKEENSIEISITSDGRYFFSINEKLRGPLLDSIGVDYDMKFTEKEIKEFQKLPAVGVSINQLKQYLNLTEAQREQTQVGGIPSDSSNLELVEWIRTANKLDITDTLGLGVVIKGDVNTKYPQVKKLLNILRDNNITDRFQLITNSESSKE